MPGMIKLPTIVQPTVEQFGSVFANEPERRRFAEDLTDSVHLLRCPEIIRVWAGTQVVLPLAHHQHTMAAIDAVVQRT